MLFVVFTIVIQMIIPAKTISANSADILSVLGHDVWPAAGGRVIVAGVMLSSLATLETALIQVTRTLLVMSRDKTMPAVLGRVHRSWHTPWAAAVIVTVIAIGLFAASNFVGSVSKLLSYGVSAIGLQIAVYYGLAGIAVAVAYRKVLLAQGQPCPPQAARTSACLALPGRMGRLFLGSRRTWTSRQKRWAGRWMRQMTTPSPKTAYATQSRPRPRVSTRAILAGQASR